MRIAEIFYSIQGEGELTGVPSVFVRTSGCNLRCRWCDTKYASWNPEGEDRDLDQIRDEVLRQGAHHVVVTGGEPMVARGIHELMASLREAGQHLTIETAATVIPGGVACDLASLSPKLSNSTPLPGEIAPGWIQKHESLRFQPDVIRAWMEDRAALLARRDIDDIFRAIDHLNLTTQWAQSKASPEQLDAVTDGLLLAMHDLRSVLVRKKAERLMHPGGDDTRD